MAAAAIALVVPALLVTSIGSPAFATTDEEKLSQLQKQSSAAASDIGVRDAAAQQAALALLKIQSQVTAAQTSLQTANDDLRTARSQLDQKRGDLARAQTAERKAETELAVATRRYDKARTELRGMLRSAYEEGVGGDLDALMQGGTPDELADRVGLLERVSETRNERLEVLGTARSEMTRKQQELSALRDRAQTAVVAADDQVDEVARAQETAESAATRLVALQRDQESATKTAKTAAAAAHQRYETLQTASARLEKQLADRAAAERSVTSVPLSTGKLGPKSKGGLVMPVTGTFTSGFGYRSDPFGLGRTFHAGQDISAPTGTPIIAATAGSVAIVETPDQSGGYGNYTCIDRGAGFATCYAHQSVVFVKVGQIVAQGQTIGLVGSTGASTGPHLHFEVRLNGTPVDPDPYLP